MNQLVGMFIAPLIGGFLAGLGFWAAFAVVSDLRLKLTGKGLN